MLPVEVDARSELLSDAWIAAAREFLEAASPDVTFTLCESFSDPPPGVHDAWHVRIDHGWAEAGPGAVADADLRVEGDYQTVLAMAQTVYAAGPEAVNRAQRELAHRAGKDAIRVTGTAPPELQSVLGALHDHMAARTIENPNLEHRIERLGLERQALELAEHGFTIIERAVSEDFADELREHVEREVRSHHPFTSNGLLLRHRVFEEVALHPLACAAAQSVLGRGMILGAMSGTYKEAGPGLIDLHADYPLVRPPFPEPGLIAVACWALDDWSEDAGPTWVIPGSHRLHRGPTRDDRRDGGVPLVMPKGSIALWANGVWHWQGERTAPGARVAIHVTYNRVFVRPLDDLGAVGEAHYARNPPAFATLLGQDDPFGKSSYTGHDMKRFAYAGRLL